MGKVPKKTQQVCITNLYEFFSPNSMYVLYFSGAKRPLKEKAEIRTPSIVHTSRTINKNFGGVIFPIEKITLLWRHQPLLLIWSNGKKLSSNSQLLQNQVNPK